MNIYYSPEFVRRFKKLPQESKLKALEKEKIFKKAPRNPKLRIHKLSGNLAGKLAFWVDFRTRIIFSFVNSETVYFHSIGSHDIYK